MIYDQDFISSVNQAMQNPSLMTGMLDSWLPVDPKPSKPLYNSMPMTCRRRSFCNVTVI
ncbi:MAG TPA: hypothetical protein VGK10_15660 [Prolixibacteraceae bacterium]|jgi:hypothetical protein